MADDTHICGMCKCEFHSLDDFIIHKKTCKRCHTRFSAERGLDSTNAVGTTKCAKSRDSDLTHEVNTTGSSENDNLGNTTSIPGEMKLIQFVPVVQGITDNMLHQQQLLPMILMPSADKPVQEVFLESPIGSSNSQSFLKADIPEKANTQQIVLIDTQNMSYEVDNPFTGERLGIVTLDEHNQTIETEKIYPKWVVSGKESETVSVMDTPIDLSGPSPEDQTRLTTDQVLSQDEIFKLTNSSVLDAIDSTEHDKIVVPHSALGDAVDHKTLNVTSETIGPLLQPTTKLQELDLLAKQANIADKGSVLASRKHHCKRCNLPFTHKKDLNRHMRVHTGVKPYACSFCDKKFTRTDKRKIHERSHTGEKPYKCKSCPYACTDSTNLKKHVMIHSGERPFSCQICEYTCRNSSQLTLHIRTHTGDAPYACYICGYSFKIKSDLTRHMRIHSGEKPFKCKFCDYRCSIKSNLKSHEKTNHDLSKILLCQYCDFKTSSRKNFTIHMSSVHDFVGENFKCHQCDFSTRDKLLLKRHLKKTHNVAGHYSCDLCSFTAEKKVAMNKHVKKKHSQSPASKPPKPSKTDKKPALQEKVWKRTNAPAMCQKKFKCSKCDATFARKNSLSCHLRNHNDTEKIMAMAVLDLQKPFVSRPESSIATETAASHLTINDVSTVNHVQMDDTLARTVAQQTVDKPSLATSNMDSLMQSSGDCEPVGSSTKGPTSSSTVVSNSMNLLESDGSRVTVSVTPSSTSQQSFMQGGGSQGFQSKTSSTCVASALSSSPQLSAAFLSQAANNLLAFMQNNQNRAVEDNMNNMARDQALNGILNVTNSMGNNSRAQPSSASVSHDVVETATNAHTTQHLPKAATAQSTLTQQFSGPEHSGSNASREIPSTTVLGSNAPIQSSTTMNQGLLLKEQNSSNSGTTGSSVRVSHTQMAQANQSTQMPHGRISSGQSSWEQLQEAVLQHSVNLQSAANSEPHTHFDRDISPEIHTANMPELSGDSTAILPGNLSEQGQSRSDFIVMS